MMTNRNLITETFRGIHMIVEACDNDVDDFYWILGSHWDVQGLFG
jgi:hypothetical protein